MPQVQMPDGSIVDMPDTLTPELATRLKAFQAKSTPGFAKAPPATPATAPGASNDVGAPTPVTGMRDAGASQDEDSLIKAYGGNPDLIKKSSMYKPGSLAALAANKEGYGGSIHERFGAGAAEPIIGLAQIGEHLLGSPESQELFNVVQRINQSKYNATKPAGTDVAHGLGAAAGTAAVVPAGEGTLTGTLASGALSSALQPVSPDSPSFWGEKATQLAEGAGAATLTHGITKGIGAVASKGLEKAASFVREHSPEKFSADLLSQAARLPYDNIDQIRAAAAGQGSRANAAKALLTQIEQAGQDMPRVMQSSLGIKSLKAKMVADAAFATRDELATGVQVDVKKPLSVLDSIIAEAENPETASKWPESDKQNLIPKLKEFRDRLASTSETKTTPVGGLVDAQGNPIVKTATKETPNTFKGLSNTRSDIGDEVRAYYKGNNATIGAKGAAELQRVKDALADSLSDAAQKSGNKVLAAADTKARGLYQDMVKTFRDPQIVNAMHSTNPDEVLQGFVRAGADRGQKLFDALDTKGRAAAMYGMAQAGVDAMQKADGDIRPFASAVKQQAKAMGVFFTGPEAERLKGISNLITGLNVVAKLSGPAAGAASVAPLGPHAMLGGALAGGAVNRLGAEKYTGELLKWMLTSPSSSGFLSKLANLSPASSTTSRFIQNQLPKMVATYRTQAEGMQRFNEKMNPPEQPPPTALPHTPQGQTP